jgi:hypothetical protein
MREMFVETNFRGSSLETINRANILIEAYRKDGLTLTVRQLYYQFVSKNWIPNNQKSYKNLASIISDARLAGMIDWDAIIDVTRNLRKPPAWEGRKGFMESVAPQYKIDLWETQKYRPEVWIEKDALLGVLEAPCAIRRTPRFSCRGYTSQTEQYYAGKRFADAKANDQIPVVLYLGDHDPSGLDMTRDHDERLEMFCGETVMVRRLALTYSQVERYSPPPNPAKMKDSRTPGYIRKYGKKSWELDALEPRVIQSLIKNAIERLVDDAAWDKAVAREKEEGALFHKMVNRWPLVQKYVSKLKFKKPPTPPKPKKKKAVKKRKAKKAVAKKRGAKKAKKS